MGVALAPVPILPFLNNAGQPNVGGSLLTQVGGVNYPAFQDAAGEIPLPNPIPLNSRGEISNSSGVSCELFLTAGSVYTFTLMDPSGNTIWTADNILCQASVAVGNMTDELGGDGNPGFLAGTDFTPGTSTTLTLSQYYGTAANLWVQFDAAEQGAGTFTLSGKTLTFNAPIPVGTNRVFVKGGTALTMGTPGSGTVTDASIAPSSNLYDYVYAWIGSKNNGATGNGTTNDASAISAANGVATVAGKGLYFTPGTYLIGSNVTFTVPVYFAPGAKLLIQNSVTVAFNAGLEAGIYQIFNVASGAAPGTVAINGITSVGYPEWWGAQVSNATFDNTAAINACVAACLVTVLQCAIYYVASTVLIQASGRLIRSVSPNNTIGNPSASMIVSTSATANVVQIGPDTQPGSLSQTNCGLKNITVGRNTAPNVSSAPAGVLAQYTYWTTLENVYSYDSEYGYQIKGTAGTRINFCNASRYTAGIGGTDAFYGFFIDGSANIGDAGGNASCYIDGCVVGSVVVGSNYQGLVASGAYGYSDLFVHKLETSNLAGGAQLVGNGNSGTTYDDQNEDVHLVDCIFDTCYDFGIQFTNTSAYGAINVRGGFIAFNPSASNPGGISYLNSVGSVTVSNMQINCGTNSTAKAVGAVNSSNFTHFGNTVLECGSSSGVYSLSGSNHFRIADKIVNNAVVNGNAAVELMSSCSRGKLDMTINGRAGAFSVGYFCTDSTTSTTEFACSGLDAAVFSVTNGKMDNNGTVVTSPYSTFGSNNLVSGLMV